MTQDEFWLTKSDGTVKKIGDNTYSNACFVNEISQDSSPIGLLMQSRFPTDTTIKFLGDGVPAHWQKWEDRRLNTHAIDELIVDFPEVPSDERLVATRGTISQRTRDVMDAAGMTVTPRGIFTTGQDMNQEELLASIVHGIYHMVEKHTLASMKSLSSPLSSDKRTRMTTVVDILTGRDNVLDVSLLKAYIEPSPTMMLRAYHLGAVYGIGMVHAVINDTYHRHYSAQVEESKKSLDAVLGEKR